MGHNTTSYNFMQEKGPIVTSCDPMKMIAKGLDSGANRFNGKMEGEELCSGSPKKRYQNSNNKQSYDKMEITVRNMHDVTLYLAFLLKEDTK